MAPALHLLPERPSSRQDGRAARYTFSNSSATHLLEDGYDIREIQIRTVQELLGQKDVKTTVLYTHLLNRGGKGVRSHLDGWPP